MLINGTPHVKLEYLKTSQNNNEMPFPLNQPQKQLYYSGRYAIYHAINIIGLNNGSALLAPSYCCGTEIDPFLMNNISLGFYNVNLDLSVDFDDIKEKIENQRFHALLIIHYFGFSQRMEEIVSLCNDNKVILFEDCAHAFLCYNQIDNLPLGSYGDVSIFSLRKVLPIPDGGVCIINEKSRNKEKSNNRISGLNRPNRLSILFRFSELAVNSNLKLGAHVNYGLLLRLIARLSIGLRLVIRILRKIIKISDDVLLHPNSYDFSSNATNWRISKLSERILKKQDWQLIIDQRRKNYIFLVDRLNCLNGVKVIFPVLPKGVCPLIFPIIVKNRTQISGLLLKRGIDNHSWWNYFHPSVGWDAFPSASFLKKSILGLPIHQDLDDYHMEIIYRALKEIVQSDYKNK